MNSIHTFLLVVFLAAAGQSAGVRSRKVPDLEAQRKIDALEAQVAALQAKQQAAASPTPSGDGATRLKRLISNFPATMGSADTRVISYDIRRTDSVVSPLFAVVEIDFKREGSSNRYKAYLALENDIWRIKQIEDWSYTTGKQLELQYDPIVETDPSDADWKRIQQYLK